MFHTYYIDSDLFYDYGFVGLVLKAENKKEALVRIKNRYPNHKISIHEICRLDKLEIKEFQY